MQTRKKKRNEMGGPSHSVSQAVGTVFLYLRDTLFLYLEDVA